MFSSTAKAALERRKESSKKSLLDASVVHAVPGRIRLRVPVLRWEPDLAGSLKAFLQAQPGIIDADVNVWAYSVTVNCEPSCWPTDVLCAFLQQAPHDEIERYKVLPSPNETANSFLWSRISPSTCWKVLGYVTLVAGIILFVLPMVPGGSPFLVLSYLCFSRAAALTVPAIV